MPREDAITREDGGGKIRRFGTMKGIFVPTLLMNRGVIKYFRLGWVAGSVGLPNAWMIILLAFTNTTKRTKRTTQFGGF